MSLIYNLVDFLLMNNNEKDIFKKIKNEKKRIIFDVGSFEGKFTEKLLKLESKSSKSKYYLFDPNPNGLKYIERLINNNKNIFYSCIGLNDKVEKKTFYLNNFFEASGSSFQTVSKNDKLWNLSRKILIFLINIFNFKILNDYKILKVKTDTIDNFCSLNKINKIDLLKIDSEGHEEFILKGSIKMLKKRKIKTIYLEILSKKNNFNLKKKRIINFLRTHKFICLKEYPIRSVSILSNLKCSDLLFINQNYKNEK
jgi:FkbM family methyltransferase